MEKGEKFMKFFNKRTGQIRKIRTIWYNPLGDHNNSYTCHIQMMCFCVLECPENPKYAMQSAFPIWDRCDAVDCESYDISGSDWMVSGA